MTQQADTDNDLIDTSQAVAGEEVPVIRTPPVLDAAYRDGYQIGTEITNLSEFKKSDLWADDTAAWLRQTAGFEDSAGDKTFSRDRLVVVIPTDLDAQPPRLGTAMRAGAVFETLEQVFDVGARDAMEGRPPEPARAASEVNLGVGR